MSFGSGFELGGRRLFLSNPVAPFWPDFRVEWDTSGGPVDAPAAVAQAFSEHLASVRVLGPLVGVSGFLVLIVAPLALALGYSLVFLAAVAAGLLVTIAACVVVVLRRVALGLTAGQAASVVFVAIVCLPCGPNVVRAVTRRRLWRLNAQDLALLGFPESDVGVVRGQVRAELVHARRFVAEEGKEQQVIDAQLHALDGPLHAPDEPSREADGKSRAPGEETL